MPNKSKGRPIAKPPTVPSRKVGKVPMLVQLPTVDPRGDGSRYFLNNYVPNNTPIDSLHDKFRGSFMWSVYGDACGMPFETKSPMEIFDKGGWVTGLTEPTNSFSTFLKLGGWTDDTQLKLAIMEAILESNAVDMDAIAQGHVRIFQEGPRGWGGSTREAVQKLKSGRSWKISGTRNGAGNGIPMKVGVIGALYGIAYSHELKNDLWRTERRNVYRSLAIDVRNVAIMTHLDSRAIVAGIIHAILVAWALNNIDPIEKWDDIMKMTKTLESIFPATDMTLSSRLSHIENSLHRDVEYFAHLFRTGCFVVESYPFSVATYLLYRNRVHEAVLAAVNAGGDCDSTASMVGELCGAEAGLGTEGPTTPLEQHDNLLGVADAYYHYCRNKHRMQFSI